jgi:shikimate dehydrogenase
MMEITGRTALLAILADPVAQARAPGLVNTALASRGCDAVLVPLRVPSEALEQVVTALRSIRNFKGAVVSMPHRSRMLSLVDEATPQAREVGACNVIRREADGRLIATMYDGEGFVAGLRRAGHGVAGRRAFLAGAGGAASAIAFALGKFGAAALTIHNRTAAKAQALAARVQRAWPRLAVGVDGEDARGHDLVINGTSLGMREGDPLPLDARTLDRGAVAAEIVISDAATPFLVAARERGCAVHFGKPMLEAQIDLMIEFMGLAPEEER